MFASCATPLNPLHVIIALHTDWLKICSSCRFCRRHRQGTTGAFFGEIIDMSAIWFWISKSIAEVIMYIVFMLCVILIALWINKR